MAVSDGQQVNAAVTNAAYVSKTSTSSQQMVAPLDLNRASGSGSQVSDVQLAINTNIADIALRALLTDARFPTTDEKDALAGTFGVPSSSNAYVTDTDPRVPDSLSTFTIADNQVAASDVTGLLFSAASTHGGKVDVLLRRRDDTEERVLVGHINVLYNLDATSWDIITVLDGSVASGVTFTITAAGQVQYTSDSMGGANYFGELQFRKVVEFNTFSS